MRVEISIDGKTYEVEKGDNLLDACLSLGLDVPYFCWHPALGSVGSCRQCAVKSYRDEDDTKGRLVMSCMEAAAEGTRISIADDEAVEFREQVIEWLMVNHPHDCPVCDEGGECHLQDMTVQTGHDHRRYDFKKRTHRNQDLGPFIHHEMNRCIACYRCVRFYKDHAGGEDLDVFGAHDAVYFGRKEDGTLESEFSGNLVEVCPTGVFTDKTLRPHYTRKWDLQTAPSVCAHCSLGCNTIPGERYGEVRRIVNRYHEDINGYFLCDRGRFGYEFINGDGRVREPLARVAEGAALEPASRETALELIAASMAHGQRVLGIGSPRASVESNFALRELVGPESFFAGVSQHDFELVGATLEIMQANPARPPSLRDVRGSDAVLLLGEDPTDTAPLAALALRQAVRQEPLRRAEAAGIPAWHDSAARTLLQGQSGPLFVATPTASRLDDVATATRHAPPSGIARLGFAVAHALDSKAPAVAGLTKGDTELVAQIAEALSKADNPLVVSGTGSGSVDVLRAAASVATALRSSRSRGDDPHSRLFLTVPECNSIGLALMGGQPLDAACELVAGGAEVSVIVLENDLYRRMDATRVDAFIEHAQHVTLVDHQSHETARRSDVVLPAATFAEAGGTLVNNEGRAQPFYQVLPPAGEVALAWRWLRDVCAAASDEAPCSGALDGIATLEDVRQRLSMALSVFALCAERSESTLRYEPDKVPRASQRYSGRTAMHADVNVHEQKPPDSPDSTLAFSMEGQSSSSGALTTSYWAPGWNSVQALNKFQHEVGGALRGGEPGRSLVLGSGGKEPAYAQDAPGAQARKRQGYRLIPRHHIFGSDELSLRAPGVLERVPAPHVALNPDDAQKIGVAAGDLVDLTAGDASLRLTVVVSGELAPGRAALPIGLPGVGFVDLAATATIVRAEP